MANTEPMVHWIRTFWKPGLESFTVINEKGVYPSKQEALEAAVHRIVAENVPEPYIISQDYDIVDMVYAVHVGWYTNVANRLLVPAFKLQAVKSVLADREAELLKLKGPCSSASQGCPLHYAHSGPCDIPPKKS